MRRSLGLFVGVVAALSAVAAGAADAPPLRSACGSTAGLTARPLWLTASDGVRLYAIEAGGGRVGVVLAHQGRSDLCGELPYAKTLVGAGLRVLAFDFRGNGHSALPAKDMLAYRRDFAAAIARLHADGATQVFLIGASMGGAAAVQNAGGLPLAGIVSLSGTRLWSGYGINKPGPRALRAPLLYVGSKDDWRAPLGEARSIVRSAGSLDKRSVFYAGSAHGWDLVQYGPLAARTRALIVEWIERRTHS